MNPWKHHHEWSQVVNFSKFVFTDALKMHSLALFVLIFFGMAVTDKWVKSATQIMWVIESCSWGLWVACCECPPRELLVKVSEPLETHILMSFCVMLINYCSLNTAWKDLGSSVVFSCFWSYILRNMEKSTYVLNLPSKVSR